LAKTDRVDAVVLACFGKATKPRLYQTPPPSHDHLRALSERRAQVIGDRVREQNRLEACHNPLITKQLKVSIQRLEKDEKNLDKLIVQAIDADQTMKAKHDVLTAEYGVGTQVATVLLTRLPELGTINRQEIAALAGLAPYDRSSGTWNGRRAIAGGRADVRSALYMAALTAVRFDETLKATYLNLLKRGKDKKLTLIACARKLLVRLNSLMATQMNTKPASSGGNSP
jgi:transposase